MIGRRCRRFGRPVAPYEKIEPVAHGGTSFCRWLYYINRVKSQNVTEFLKNFKNSTFCFSLSALISMPVCRSSLLRMPRATGTHWGGGSARQTVGADIFELFYSYMHAAEPLKKFFLCKVSKPSFFGMANSIKPAKIKHCGRPPWGSGGREYQLSKLSKKLIFLIFFY